MILFLIPFPSKAYATDWDLACRLLQETLDSVANQSDRRFRVMLCCHDIPEVFYRGNPEEMIVHQVSFPPGTIVNRGNIDRNWRLCSGHFAARLNSLPCEFIFPLDADDLVHRDLTRFILTSSNVDCWQVRLGFQLDHKTSRFFPTDRIHDISGTSFCLKADASVFCPYTGDPFFSSIFCEINHKTIVGYVAEKGLAISSIPFRSVAYRVNNRRSIVGSERRALSGEAVLGYMKNLAKFTLIGHHSTPEEMGDFGLSLSTSDQGFRISSASRLQSLPPQ